MAPDSNCDSCREDYEFTKEMATMYVYLANIQASNVEAECPNCQTVETIFLSGPAILHLAQRQAAKLILCGEPPDDIAERAEKTWASYRKPKALPELPEIPREWAIEFFDTLREFGRES